MKITNTATKIETYEKTISAYCDWCGEEFDEITTQCSGFGHINFGFGYGSLFDDDSYELHICDACFIKEFGNKLKNQIDKKSLEYTTKQIESGNNNTEKSYQERNLPKIKEEEEEE